MKTTTHLAFSNGNEFMFWQSENCEKCVKATFYNDKTNDFPKYRCVIQGQIDGQCVGLIEISQRSFDATRDRICPYRKTERKKYHKREKLTLNIFEL